MKGPISFIARNAGQQLLYGSFHPIETEDWAATAYITPLELFVNAISDHDYEAVRRMLSVTDDRVDVNGLTLDGWSPLQIAIKTNAYNIIPDLIRSGARWSSFGDSSCLPAYQELPAMQSGPWPLTSQVQKLAHLLEELLLQVFEKEETQQATSDVQGEEL